MSIKLDMSKIPSHIAIILDGNGRWAKERGMPREFGHKRGFKTLLNVAKYCNELGVKCLTVYAFSTENWNRPEKEVSFLMSIPKMFIDEKKEIFLIWISCWLYSWNLYACNDNIVFMGDKFIIKNSRTI